ncbi:MAG: alpha/beta hydrolase [Bacteroidota bacterium]
MPDLPTHTLVCIPGLGYDRRIFQKLSLPGVDLVFIDWLEPERKESMTNYVRRMANQLDHLKGIVSFLGHSFGGVLAQHLASYFCGHTSLSVERIILVSSIKARQELSPGFRRIAPLGLQVVFHKSWVLPSVHLWGRGHGFIDPEKLALFKSMVGSYTNHYLRWALRQLSLYQNLQLPSDIRLYHFHGDDDQTLPVQFIQAPFREIKGGNHIMILDKADLLNPLILESLTGNEE